VTDPNAELNHPALYTWLEGNHALRFDGWCYIQYRNGEEELYRDSTDPDQRVNLASEPNRKEQLSQFKALLRDVLKP